MDCCTTRRSETSIVSAQLVGGRGIIEKEPTAARPGNSYPKFTSNHPSSYLGNANQRFFLNVKLLYRFEGSTIGGKSQKQEGVYGEN